MRPPPTEGHAVTEVWEVGDLVITALLLWLIAGAVPAGLLCAAVGSGTVWAWRRLYGRWRDAGVLGAPPEPQPPERASQGHLEPAKPHAPA
jgi:hypothetical protein